MQHAIRMTIALGGLLAFLGASFQVQAAPPSLVKAYKKEFAFLQAQKRALKARLKRVVTSGQQRVASTKSQLKTMQLRIMLMREQAEQIQRTLQDSGNVQSQRENFTDQIDKVLERARFTLKKGGWTLPEKTKSNEYNGLLATAFTKGSIMMRRGNQVRKRKGAFFLKDGTRTQGTIIEIGGIAAYGISKTARGALAPAGQGQLKLWPKPAASTASSFASGQFPASLQIFLFESRDKNIAFKAEKTLYQFLQSGGVIGWIIVGLGIFAALLVLLRALILWRSSAGTTRLLQEIDQHLAQGNRDAALQRCQKSNNAASRIFLTALQHLDKSRQHVEELIAEAMLKETPAIERFGAIITVTAAVAPLLGLLGTVTGMISTFDVITEYGTGDPKLLAGGISEALVTTQLGLVVAIPALLLGSMLAGRAESILNHMEWGALRILNAAHKPAQTPNAGTQPQAADRELPTSNDDIGAVMRPAFEQQG